MGVENHKLVEESSFLEDVRKNQLKKSALHAAKLVISSFIEFTKNQLIAQ